MPARGLPRLLTTPLPRPRLAGGCWAFSATEAIESSVAIATGTLLELSPQEILACTLNPHHCGGSGGCNGATQVSLTAAVGRLRLPAHAQRIRPA